MPDLAYLTISGRGQDQRVEIAEQDVAAIVNEFQAIGEDPGKFEAFVKRAALGGFKITRVLFSPAGATAICTKGEYRPVLLLL